jgi:8-oxo-dGTP pyrophosphatase MutT (NUDIX family)
MAIWSRDAYEIRVSFAALVRIRDDDRYVLFHSQNRPGSWSPPGGVFKYFEPAAGLLERFGFRADRYPTLADVMRRDLRGFLPAESLAEFISWFDSGAYREDSIECLRREMVEELGEVGLHDLTTAVPEMSFRHVNTIVEEPVSLPDRPYRQLRRLEVHDLVVASDSTAKARRAMLDAGADPGFDMVVCASAAEIRHGRCGTALLGGNSEYLIGSTRIAGEVPPMR